MNLHNAIEKRVLLILGSFGFPMLLTWLLVDVSAFEWIEGGTSFGTTYFLLHFAMACLAISLSMLLIECTANLDDIRSGDNGRIAAGLLRWLFLPVLPAIGFSVATGEDLVVSGLKLPAVSQSSAWGLTITNIAVVGYVVLRGRHLTREMLMRASGTGLGLVIIWFVWIITAFATLQAVITNVVVFTNLGLADSLLKIDAKLLWAPLAICGLLVYFKSEQRSSV